MSDPRFFSRPHSLFTCESLYEASMVPLGLLFAWEAFETRSNSKTIVGLATALNFLTYVFESMLKQGEEILKECKVSDIKLAGLLFQTAYFFKMASSNFQQNKINRATIWGLSAVFSLASCYEAAVTIPSLPECMAPTLSP